MIIDWRWTKNIKLILRRNNFIPICIERIWSFCFIQVHHLKMVKGFFLKHNAVSMTQSDFIFYRISLSWYNGRRSSSVPSVIDVYKPENEVAYKIMVVCGMKTKISNTLEWRHGNYMSKECVRREKNDWSTKSKTYARWKCFEVASACKVQECWKSDYEC